MENGATAQPLVSVVIPAYNAEKFIARAIGSVLAQQWERLELIVVDDGSRDDTRGAVERFGDRVKFIRQSNGGAAAARNRGIRESRGEFIAFQDADDEWLPGRLERTVRPLIEHKDASFCYTRAWRLLLSGRKMLSDEESGKNRHRLGIYAPEYIVTPGVTVRRSSLDEAGLFDESMTQCEDLDLYVRLMEVGGVIEIEEPLVLVHESEGSLRTRGDAALRAEMAMRPTLKALERGKRQYHRRGALSAAYLAGGIQYLDGCERGKAFKYFMKSFALIPRWRSFQFAARSLLPAAIQKNLRKLKRG